MGNEHDRVKKANVYCCMESELGQTQHETRRFINARSGIESEKITERKVSDHTTLVYRDQKTMCHCTVLDITINHFIEECQ